MKRIAIAICVATLLILVVTSGSRLTGARAQKGGQNYLPFQERERFVPGRVLVKFRSGIMPDHARNIIAALGARDADEIPNIGVHVLDLPYQVDETGFAQAMAQRPEVEFAELDKIVEPSEITPNDPLYPNAEEWHLRKIGAPAAWSMSIGADTIIIAILDTGVDAAHPDLAPKMVSGWNVYDNNSNTNDVYGHGTQVAGVAGAMTNNGEGVASVAWGCRLMPVRISALNGTSTYSAMANGLNWAADHGARVANISYIASDSSTVRSAAQYFQTKGGVVVAAAGNSSIFDSNADNPYILTVSAVDQTDVLSYWSNIGNNIDLAAPEGAGTTLKGGGYVYAGGTSISSPIVAGVAALMMSANSTLTPNQVQNILKQNADDLGPPGWDTSYGSGRVNAARAVSAAMAGAVADATAPTVSVAAPTSGATVSGMVTVQISASDNVGVVSVHLVADGNAIGTDVTSPYTFVWDTRTTPNGLHTLSVTATDGAGNWSNFSVPVTVTNGVADTTPPIVTIISPQDSARVTTNVSVTISASDNLGVTKNELYADGVLVSVSTTAPFTIKWNSRKAAIGVHTLRCKAYDAAGNAAFSQIVTVYK